MVFCWVKGEAVGWIGEMTYTTAFYKRSELTIERPFYLGFTRVSAIQQEKGGGPTLGTRTH